MLMLTLAGKDSKTFRKNAWSGIVGLDLLRRLLQERRPYELVKGESDKAYLKYREELSDSVSNGAKDIGKCLKEQEKLFMRLRLILKNENL
jgi:predicted nucleotide-binding protein (sugar kinase/HSP70/actin superfamily)